MTMRSASRRFFHFFHPGFSVERREARAWYGEGGLKKVKEEESSFSPFYTASSAPARANFLHFFQRMGPTPPRAAGDGGGNSTRCSQTFFHLSGPVCPTPAAPGLSPHGPRRSPVSRPGQPGVSTYHFRRPRQHGPTSRPRREAPPFRPLAMNHQPQGRNP